MAVLFCFPPYNSLKRSKLVATQKSQVYRCNVCGNTVEVAHAGGGTLTCCQQSMTLVVAKEGASDDKAPHIILGIHVTDRAEHGFGIQKVLSEYGTNIKTRLGLHDVHGDFCSPNALILVELIGDESRYADLSDRLTAIEGVEVKRMVFDHS
jgi:desulfoferrodoxin-like iron-binding protein